MKEADAVILADTHVGDVRAVFPPGQMLKAGPRDTTKNIYNLNLAQEWLYSCMEDMRRKMPKRYALIVAGDIIQGFPDRWSPDLCANDPKDQVNSWVNLMLPWMDHAVMGFVEKGTRAHSNHMIGLEEDAAEKLAKESGKRVRYAHAHDIQILNKNINVLHGHSTVSDNLSTPLEAEIRDSIVKEKTGQAPHADLIVRAHIHPDSWAPYARYNRLAFFAPCWQLTSDYIAAGLARYYRKINIIGGVLVKITERPMPYGITLEPYLPQIPQEEMPVVKVPW